MDVIETKRLRIRPFTPKDLDAAHQLLDQDLEWSGPDFTREQRQARLQFHIDLAHWVDMGALFGDRALILKETGQLIGLAGFRPWILSPETRALFGTDFWGETAPAYAAMELGIGYALHSRHRQRGYATEAASALIDYAFHKIKVERVIAITARQNNDSIRLMERLGMRLAYNPAADWPGAIGILDNVSPE
jgi:[ribosomal protein S5]-alanine N-acetyltransferase